MAAPNVAPWPKPRRHTGSSLPASGEPRNTLPRDNPAFIGRRHELRTLVEDVRSRDDAGAVRPIYVIHGMPGVGKTTLAVHAGHLLENRFPDGQFFIDLHGYTAGNQPLQPRDALVELLSATGLDPTRIPPDLGTRVALWRSRMAGRRALVILDNAADQSQVQPLLPGAGGCLVIVTSRRRLTDLSANQAAAILPLETLPPDDAAALFAAIANRDHADPADGAVRDLVRLTGHLPLAICLLAARLRPEPRWRAGDLVDELAEAKHRLAHMRAGEAAVAAAFDVSYRRLPPARRRFFRRLGLHPGADLDRYAAAALDDGTPATARQHLEALYHDHLLDQPVLGRFQMHNLIREYARIRVEGDPRPDRDAAVARLLDYYQGATSAADRLLSRPYERRAAGPVGAGSKTPALPNLRTRQQAMEWMRTEQGNLFHCATLMSSPPWYDRLAALAAAMATYLRLSGPWDRATALHAAAAGRAADDRIRAGALREAGVLYRFTGQYALAESALGQALELGERTGDRTGVADALTQVAAVRWRTGDAPGAAARLDQALSIYRAVDDRHGQADALVELGGARMHAGDYPEAVDTLRQALAIHQNLGDLHGTALALSQLGAAQQLTGEDRTAIEALERALVLYRQLGDRHGAGRTLNYLGISYCGVDDHAAARAALVEALTTHRDLGYRTGQANALNYLGLIHLRSGDYPAAERLLSEALAIYRQLRHRQGEADSLNHLGELARTTGDHADAAGKHEQALALFQRASDGLGQTEALNSIGELLLVRGEPIPAMDCFQRAREEAVRVHNAREEANALAGAGRCALSLGKPEEAVDRLRRAEAIYRRIGAVRAVDDVATLLARCDAAGMPPALPAASPQAGREGDHRVRTVTRGRIQRPQQGGVDLG